MTRWKITPDVIGRVFEIFAWLLIFIAFTHILEFIYASCITVWILVLKDQPELFDRISVSLFWQAIWLSIFVGGLIARWLLKRKNGKKV